MHTEVPRGRIPPVWPPYFDAAIWFAFLMRTDVRKGADWRDEEARKRFLVWWLADGRREYQPTAVTLEQRAVLWELVDASTDQGPRRVPRLLQGVLGLRRDVADAFDPDTAAGLEQAMAWLLVHGLGELRMSDVVDDRIREQLMRPLASPGPDRLPLPWLARQVWLLDPELRLRFDLSSSASRDTFADWFFTTGASVHDLWHLVDGATLRHLRQEVLPPGGDRPVSRLALACMRAGLVPPAYRPPLASWAVLADWVAAHGPSLPDPQPRTGASPATAPQPDGTSGRPVGVSLVGYAYGELGIGEDVRMAAAACTAAEIPFGILDYSQALETRTDDRSVAHLVRDAVDHPVSVFSLTGFDTARHFIERGAGMFRDRYVIGYWPWELPDWPAPWRAAFDLVDEIWTSSRFTQEAFALDSPVPVLHMPMAVELGRVEPLDRADLLLPRNRFLFLYTFDANSYLARKNPMAAIAAFRRAFPRGDEPVGLVLKTMNARPGRPDWDAFMEMARNDPRIHLITATFDKGRTLGLMAACDSYLSLHRAEGFGRTIAEAMLLRRPVIATGWSGSDELVTPETALPVAVIPRALEPDDYPWGEGSHWAEPDIEQAADHMRRLVADEALAARLGEAGCAHVKARHGAAVVGARYRRRLDRIMEMVGHGQR